MIFETTTGANPRLHCFGTDFEKHAVVRQTRFAQKLVLGFALKLSPKPLQLLESALEPPPTLHLDSGVLAAAVGPIAVKVRATDGRKPELLVLLGVRCPEDEIVMLRPARQTRDLFGSISDEDRERAVAQARATEHSAESPLLAPGKHVATFANREWHLDGMPWRSIANIGRRLEVRLIPAPACAMSMQLSEQDVGEALKESLCSVGEGAVKNAQTYVTELFASCTASIGLRAVSMLRQQYTKISLPTPALSGSIGADQLAAYAGDWDVYQLLAFVSRLVPAALRPATPPTFHVRNAPLLRVVERWMNNGLRRGATKRLGNSGHGRGLAGELSAKQMNPWSAGKEWGNVAEVYSNRLMEHQKAAVDAMIQRDKEADTGHFLIMDTGIGKTITALCYLYHWLCKPANGGSCRYIIWVTPKGTVENLVKQLKHTWSAPVCQVPRVSKPKAKSSATDGASVVLQHHKINVIHADDLGTAIDAGLAELAPASVIVFDEVDEMYAPTLRTSAARRLAQLTPKFVAQTATPMRRNESQLLAWLADTCSFPVDARNLLVAAAGMVSIQIELGISSTETLKLE
eukprot:SAG31_NODE_5750_length_2345_cov_1.681211_2_plen_574_part_01